MPLPLTGAGLSAAAAAAPVADFTAFPLSLASDDISTFDFTDTSTGSPTGWTYEASVTGAESWQIIGTTQNPSISGADLNTLLGRYEGPVDVRLTVTPGGSSKKRSGYLTLTAAGGGG